MIRKGRNNRKPISKARFSSEIMKAGTRIRSERSWGVAGGGSPETRGKEGVRGKIDWWVKAMEIHSFDASEPFVGHDRFVVQYDADVTDKKSKERRKLSEVGVYTVKNGKIVREEFLPRV